MDRIVITIRPTPSDEVLLRVEDAMQQVIDALKVFEQAKRALVSPQESFEWRLERASSGSPFTVTAVAAPLHPMADVAPQVNRVKAEVSKGLRDFIKSGTPPVWMDPESIRVTRNIFSRTKNGIGRTDIDFDFATSENVRDILSIDSVQAEAGIRAIAALNLFDDADLPERESFGEIEGIMLAAGRYRNRPAVQIRSDLYGFVWCTLSQKVIDEFGTEHSVADVWKGKTIGVHGRLSYGGDGMLKRIDVLEIREIQAAAPIDLNSILDPNFTAGMDPNEYLEKLHAGELG
jgi:hypothetical protein